MKKVINNKRQFQNYLVTGGYGFIGSNYIKNLSKKDKNVLNIDACLSGSNLANLNGSFNLSKYIFHKININDPLIEKLIIENDIEVIVHFAAESHVDRSITSPRGFLESNFTGTFNLLEAARNAEKKLNKKIHFHHVSTDEVYGSLSEGDLPFKETNQYQPNSPYSASKAGSDFLVRAWHHTYGLNVTTSNCSNNYGPNQHAEKLIPKIIMNALFQQKIPVYGDGQNIRDWLYVNDHCEAIDAIIHNGNIGETYNIGGKNEIKNIEIIEIILKILTEKVGLDGFSPLDNKAFKIKSFQELIAFVDDRPGHDFRYAINPNKIEDHLNWKPKETFESGIEKTVDWYLENIDWLRDLNE